VLKVLRQVPDVAEGKNTFDRFIREYELIARIDHPNVVRIYDLGVADDHAYIAMEYFPDGDLRTRLRGPMPSETALVYLAQIAEALAAIHAVGVLHRDLKPGNVMLREDGSVALIDFGLARELRMEAEITETGEIFGTPYYMSPEQGHADHLDERADLYSLGVIFYEMLTGKKPYMGSTPMAVIYMHSHAPLPRFDPGLAHLQPLLDRMMAKEPGERFQSAEELLDVLALLVPEQTVQQARSLT
jgi:serine/threonine protein kinase